MLYWIRFISLFMSLTAIVLYLLYLLRKKRKYGTMEHGTFIGFLFLLCLVLFLFVPLSIDISSALSGGQDLYVNELPTCIWWGTVIPYVDTNNQQLRHLKGCSWNLYEKYGNYHIRYTKLTKIILAIEKLD